MREVEFVPFRLTEVAEIFSIRIDGNETTELHRFLHAYMGVDNDSMEHDFQQILQTLAGVSRYGVRESFFRPEGKMTDRICAIPLFASCGKLKDNGTLRLYCIRISDRLLIVGGGGVKVTKTYQEDECLAGYVQTLQRIDKELSVIESEGKDIEEIIYNIKLYID